MTKEDRSHNRAPPVGPKRNSRGSVSQEADSKSPIPLGLLAGVSIITSIRTSVRYKPGPILTGVGLTGGVIMGVMSMRWYKNGPTEDTMFGAMLGSTYMAMAASAGNEDVEGQALRAPGSEPQESPIELAIGSNAFRTGQRVLLWE